MEFARIKLLPKRKKLQRINAYIKTIIKQEEHQKFDHKAKYFCTFIENNFRSFSVRGMHALISLQPSVDLISFLASIPFLPTLVPLNLLPLPKRTILFSKIKYSLYL